MRATRFSGQSCEEPIDLAKSPKRTIKGEMTKIVWSAPPWVLDLQGCAFLTWHISLPWKFERVAGRCDLESTDGMCTQWFRAFLAFLHSPQRLSNLMQSSLQSLSQVSTTLQDDDLHAYLQGSSYCSFTKERHRPHREDVCSSNANARWRQADPVYFHEGEYDLAKDVLFEAQTRPARTEAGARDRSIRDSSRTGKTETKDLGAVNGVKQNEDMYGAWTSTFREQT